MGQGYTHHQLTGQVREQWTPGRHLTRSTASESRGGAGREFTYHGNKDRSVWGLRLSLNPAQDNSKGPCQPQSSLRCRLRPLLGLHRSSTFPFSHSWFLPSLPRASILENSLANTLHPHLHLRICFPGSNGIFATFLFFNILITLNEANVS